MKIKLYKGPGHGKVFNLPPDRLELAYARAPNFNWAAYSADYNDRIVSTVEVCVYRPVYMRDPQGNIAMAMHPDGSVFFKYEGAK